MLKQFWNKLPPSTVKLQGIWATSNKLKSLFPLKWLCNPCRFIKILSSIQRLKTPLKTITTNFFQKKRRCFVFVLNMLLYLIFANWYQIIYRLFTAVNNKAFPKINIPITKTHAQYKEITCTNPAQNYALLFEKKPICFISFMKFWSFF